MAAGIQAPLSVTPSRSFQSFPRSQDSSSTFSQSTVRTPASTRASLSPADSFVHSSSSSSQTPSSGSSSPTPTNSRGNKQHYQRPSTLHGLKHKLHSSACPKPLHAASPSCSSSVPNRRKSVGHIPLSPLARTPSPSPLPASPTRSPSPLAFPVGHQPGSSNTTQSYSPSVGNTPQNAGCGQTKKGFVRPKNAEPGSPLLRRALSPDRLHPRSAESKCSISPLCSSGTPPVVKTQARAGSSAVWKPVSQEKDKEGEPESAAQSCESSSTNENRLSLNLSGPGELLPRIAEEKDSPTSSLQESKDKSRDFSKCDKTGENSKKSDNKPIGSSRKLDSNVNTEPLGKIQNDAKAGKDNKSAVEVKNSNTKPPHK